MVKVSYSRGEISLRPVMWCYFQFWQYSCDVLKTLSQLKMTKIKRKVISPNFHTDVLSTGHDWFFKSTWHMKNNNPQSVNYYQAMRAVSLDMAAVPLTVFSGLDRGRPRGSVGCQSKHDLLDGIRESLEGVMAPHRRQRPCCHWLSEWQRGEWKTRNTQSCGAAELQHETSTVWTSWYLLLQKWLLCENKGQC